MDTHLTTISSTLDAIARLHADRPSSGGNVYRPFTCAVLNTYKLDVLDYIRDADQVESNLFWHPPPPGNSSGSKGEQESVEDGTSAGVASRLPEPKEFVPPTPLRKNAIEAEAKGLVQFDARTLLKAAQRLLDNYHHAPRARTHIKALLKRHNELEKQTTQHQTALADTESLIAKLSHPEHAKELAASLSGTSVSSLNPEEEIRKLHESIRREKMEILAIEQTTEDLLEKRQKVMSQRARASGRQTVKEAGKPARPLTATSPHRSDTATPKASTSVEKSPPAAQRGDTGGEREAVQPSSDPSQSATIVTEGDREGEEEEEEEGDEDVTIRRPLSAAEEQAPRGVTREAEVTVPASEPESSDELERICESIWNLFGDNLRYVAVDREGADYGETLEILQDLSVGRSSSGGDADSSMASSSSGSQATAATSGSTSSSSGQLDNAGPPSPAVAIAAHILFALLTTPSPHVMDFDRLKAEGESWWTSRGLEALRASTLGSEPSDFSDSSSSLASKAVYTLIAKKLLRLQFRGAKRIVSFPAQIG